MPGDGAAGNGRPRAIAPEGGLRPVKAADASGVMGETDPAAMAGMKERTRDGQG